MATLQASSTSLCSSNSLSLYTHRGITRAIINFPKLNKNSLSHPKISTKSLVEELEWMRSVTHIKKLSDSPPKTHHDSSDPMVMAKLYTIMEVVTNRVEMHKNIGEQRSNWNSLLLTSINSITLVATTMASIAATSVSGFPSLAALKLSSISLYLAATGVLVILNKIKPSQLAKEQRNAARLLKQLHAQIHPCEVVVKD